MTKYSGHKVTAFGHGRVAKQGVAHRNTLYFAGGTSGASGLGTHHHLNPTS